MKSRRKFIQTIAVAGAASTLPISLMAQENKKQKMIHQVYFWLNEGIDTQDFIKEASELGKCKSVDKFYIGTPAPTEARDVVDSSYQVACTLFFKSIEDQNEYQVDPKHLAFIEKNATKWSTVKVYDFVI